MKLQLTIVSGAIGGTRCLLHDFEYSFYYPYSDFLSLSIILSFLSVVLLVVFSPSTFSLPFLLNSLWLVTLPLKV